MSDTTTINVDENWQQLNLNVGESFTFNNQGPAEIFVRESAAQPLASDKGYVYMPAEGGSGIVESSPFWVRTKFGSSQFHFGLFTI